MTIKQSIEQLKKLDALGDKATKGDWSVCGHNWHESSIHSDAGEEDIIVVLTHDMDDGTVTEDNQDEREEDQSNLLNFITQAANSRQAIKDVLAYFERMSWLPIETAPRSKNGAIEILVSVLDNDGEIECCDIGSFDYEEAWIEQIEVEDGVYIDNVIEPESWTFYSNLDLIEEPTHWRPINKNKDLKNV